MKKATKKAAPKAKVTKKTTVKKAEESKAKAKPALAKNLKIKFDKARLKEFAKSGVKVLGLLLVLLLVDLFVQYLNNDYSVAIVNGQRVPKREYMKTLETMYGKQVADALVEEELVKQLGKEKDVSVDQEDVDEAYANIEEQIGGEQALEEALLANSMNKEDLREQLESELVLKAIIEPTLEYTDEDLAEFFEQYKEMLYEDATAVTFEEKKDEIKDYYIEQKTFEGRDAILSEFKTDSTIQINVPGASEEEVTYGFFKATRNLIANMLEKYNSN